MAGFIITCNAGSSNIKLAKYFADTLELKDKLVVSTKEELLAWYEKQTDIILIGHRVVHGGHYFSAPIVVDERVIEKLQTLESLAPLHQPLAISIITSIMKYTSSIVQIACFDTSFHKELPEMEKLLPLPYSYFKEGIYRYGFHGLSYEYISSILPNVAGNKAEGRVLIAHLGNGSSICGMVNLKSRVISMGFSALDGLMMGSRSGTIDPGVIIYLLKHKGFTLAQLEELLYNQSGLKGVSNISHDVRVLELDNSEEAQRALKLYCYTAAKHIGAITTVMGGIDCLVFTGGIGENSIGVRSEICSYLEWLGINIDNKLNQANLKQVSDEYSTIPVYVIPTDEEIIIVKHCENLIKSKKG